MKKKVWTLIGIITLIALILAIILCFRHTDAVWNAVRVLFEKEI